MDNDKGELVTPDRGQALFEEVYSHLHTIHAHWRMHATLFSADAVPTLREIAPFTFGIIQGLLIDRVVLGIDQLLEQAGRSTPASLATLVSRIPDDDAATRRALTRRLTRLRTICEAISVHRNKVIAHREISVVVDGESMPRLGAQQIRKAIHELSEVLDIMSTRYYGGTMSCLFRPDVDPSPFDADILIAALKARSQVTQDRKS